MEVHLIEINVRGFLPRRALGDRVKVQGSTLQVIAGRRSLSFTEGQAVKVRLVEVDFLRLQLFLELA